MQNIIPKIVTQVTTNVNNANVGNGNCGNNGCSYKTFTACNLKEFDGKGGAVALTRWIEKMESVFDNSCCTANQRVRYAACCYVNKALTWWNTQVQARGCKTAIGMSWNDFKVLLVEDFCPSNEIEKLENEFWNHTMRYINGLAPQIHGMLWATQLTTIQRGILMARILTDEAVCCGTLTKGNNKRKEMEESRWGRIRGHATNMRVLIIFAMIVPSGNKQLDKQGTHWLLKETETPKTIGTKQEEGHLIGMQ
ncbi:hypothetical protein Tco_0818098 [Tanacetum coccineum]